MKIDTNMETMSMLGKHGSRDFVREVNYPDTNPDRVSR